MPDQVTLQVFDEAGQPVADVQLAERPLQGQQVAVPAAKVKRGQRYSFRVVTDRVWRYQAGPPEIRGGQAVFTLSLAGVGRLAFQPTEPPTWPGLEAERTRRRRR